MNPNQTSAVLPSDAEGINSESISHMKESTDHPAPNLTAPRKANRAQRRADKGHTQATRGGLLSKNIEQALIRSGENPRTLRRYKKRYRNLFKPQGMRSESLFDWFWSCHLRLLLAAKMEATLLTPDHSLQRPPILAQLREGELPTLVSESDPSESAVSQGFHADCSRDLFHCLALAQRYDAYFAREAFRTADLLLDIREGGKNAVESSVVTGVDTLKIQGGGH
jgi:hypothetical protein